MFFIFLKQNFIQAAKAKAQFLQNILFFVISCAIFFILSQNQLNQASSAYLQQFLICNIIWFSLLFSLIFANGNFLSKDYEDGTIEQIIRLCPNFEIFIFSKIIANWIIFVWPILAIIPFIMLALGLGSEFITQFFWLILIASFTINFICAFCASLNIAGNQAPLLAILILPLVIPVLLIGCAGLVFNAAQGQIILDNFYFSLKILLAIAIFTSPVLLVATAKIVKIVNS